MSWRFPPEWHPQDWIWIGFPHDAEEWPGFLEAAQVQVAAFASAVADSGQDVRMLVRDEANEARARELVSAGVTLERAVMLQSIAQTLGTPRPIDPETVEDLSRRKYDDSLVNEYWQAWIREMVRRGIDVGEG